MKRFFKEFFEYLGQHKKLWLIPIVILLALFGVVLLAAQSTALAPFIYSLF